MPLAPVTSQPSKRCCQAERAAHRLGRQGAVGVDDVGRGVELLVGRDAEDLLRPADLLFREGVAVGLGVVRELWRRVADVAAQDQQGRPVLDGHGPTEGGLEGVAVVGDLTEVLGVPPVGLEALDVVVADREVGVTVDGDVVVVEHHAQVAQTQVTGEGGGLVAQALHEVAVAGQHEGVMVHHVGPKRERR